MKDAEKRHGKKTSKTNDKNAEDNSSVLTYSRSIENTYVSNKKQMGKTREQHMKPTIMRTKQRKASMNLRYKTPEGKRTSRYATKQPQTEKTIEKQTSTKQMKKRPMEDKKETTQ